MFFSKYPWLGENPATDNPEKDLEELNKRFDRCSRNKQAVEKEWHTNISYFHGRQVKIGWNWLKNRVVDLPNNFRSEIKVMVNVLWSRVITKWARQTKMEPIVDVVPRTSTIEDKEAARKSQRITNYLRESLSLDKKKMQIDFLEQLMGTVFLKICPTWDRKEHTSLPVLDENGNFLLDENGEQVWRDYPKTKICSEVVPAFNILVDDSVSSMEDLSFIMDTRVRKIDYIRERYGTKVNVERDSRLVRQYIDDIANMVDSGDDRTFTGTQSYGKPEDEEGLDKTLLIEYFEAPTARWEHGRILTFTKDKLLQAEEMGKHWNPFIKFEILSDPMKFWSSTWLTHCIPLQKRYNLQWTRIWDYIRKIMKGKFLVGKGSGISDTSFDNTNGEFVELNPTAGFVPQQMQFLPIPPIMMKILEFILQEIDIISGAREISSRGKMPANVKTATQAALLQESDDIYENPTIKAQKDSWELAYSRLLEVFEEIQEEPVAIPVMDEITGEQSMEYINGIQIKGNNRVIVQLGDGLPQSRLLKRQVLTEMWQAGILGPQQDPQVRKRLLRLLEFGEASQLYEEENIEENLVNQENAMILKGQMPQVEWWQDHASHMQGPLRLLKSRGLMLNPQVKAIAMAHAQAHGQALSSLLNQTRQEFPGARGSAPQVQQQIQQPQQQAQPPQQAQFRNLQPKPAGAIGSVGLPTGRR